MRLAYFSPLPPQPSGIADYSVKLLEFLTRDFEIDLWVSQPPRLPASLSKLLVKTIGPPAQLPNRLRDYDAIVYQMGNDRQFHRDIFLALSKVPGIVVLHDYVLHHFFAGLYLDEWQQPRRYVEEMEYNYGREGRELAEAVLAGRMPAPWEASPLDYPLSKRVVGCAEAVIVHSDFVLSRLRGWVQRPLQTIPHLDVRLLPLTSVPEAKAALGIPSQTFVLSALGHQTPYKRIAPTLRAYARFRSQVPDSLFLLVGGVSASLNVESLLPELGLTPGHEVRVLGYVRTLPDFEGYITASDVCLNLRYPTMGETSGSLLRALSHGRPALVSDVGWFSELPDDCVAKVDTDEREEDQILEYLLHLYRDEPLRRAMGENARAFVESHHNPERCAAAYREFIQEVVAHRKQPVFDLTDAVGDELAQLGLSQDDPHLEEISRKIVEIGFPD